jgi:hypothetical protein
MKNIITLSLSLLIFAGCSSLNGTGSGEIYGFQKDLTALRTHINQKEIDVQWVKEESLSLIDQAVPLLESFALKYPDCHALIKKVISEREAMLEMELVDIERLYHEGEALPEAKLLCYNPKELIVHPATVYLLTLDNKVEKPLMSMRAELEELDLHFNLFREDLLRN